MVLFNLVLRVSFYYYYYVFILYFQSFWWNIVKTFFLWRAFPIGFWLKVSGDKWKHSKKVLKVFANQSPFVYLRLRNSNFFYVAQIKRIMKNHGIQRQVKFEKYTQNDPTSVVCVCVRWGGGVFHPQKPSTDKKILLKKKNFLKSKEIFLNCIKLKIFHLKFRWT